jgi:murein DD-endopeptidase MepM/ murein hydrolase activator NlpD
LCLLAGLYIKARSGIWRAPPPLPTFATAGPYTLWSTPSVADGFTGPLQPSDLYVPLVQGITSVYAVDTRYGVQNPALGDRANCFRDAAGNHVSFSQLYHAGVDLFALERAGQVALGNAAHAPVHAVAHGVIVSVINAGSDGYVIIVEHLLADASRVYSVYWHTDQVQVQPGQPVTRKQVIAVVKDMGANSHLHWEMRTFRDGSDLFPPGTAGAQNCNGHESGVGYTWDDDSARAHPDFYGYLDPVAFVNDHEP